MIARLHCFLILVEYRQAKIDRGREEIYPGVDRDVGVGTLSLLKAFS
jgi:hypothetical protein